jgi:3-deoxy-manno-octulosonate cytidylyltransferase (CMP-KDO synthetase)
VDTIIVIPARMQSTRLPGKPLLKRDGITLIETVWRQCVQAGFETVVATDDIEISRTVESFRGKVIMTNPETPTGTDRCAEAVYQEDYKYVVNVQGDMPYITPEQIVECHSLVKQFDVGTLIYDMALEEQTNPNSVKCIGVEHQKVKQDVYECKWFGRMAVPYGFHHAGIYAYRMNALRQYQRLPQGKYEQIERLEQLRWLENGFRVFARETTPIKGEINTPEDYENWCA